ncbi:uncharacterized protein LOC135845669 isoform X2 [Planococcus citri]|uniref:uncharacterized protein LOC135845669 isoform X2 n=1 Tax=Planococcus citri TaxID=170843 RepID=UPI0031F92956
MERTTASGSELICVRTYSIYDNGTYNVKEIHNELDDDYLPEFVTDNELDEKSRLLDFEENYVKPNIKQNLKQYKNYKYAKKKRELNADSDDQYTFRYKTDNVTEAAYDYDKFKQEYDHDVDELKKSQAKLNLSDFKPIAKSECSTGLFDKGPFTMACLIQENRAGETEAIRNDAGKSIEELLKLWGIAFVLFVVIGWGNYGCCNWICPTKHCFPDDGYEEIKQKLALNPPGTLMSKVDPKTDDKSKTKFEKEYYQPSETEYYLYNSVWNDIYHV